MPYVLDKIGRAARAISKTVDAIALDSWPIPRCVHIAERRSSIRRARAIFLIAADITSDTVGVAITLGTLTDPLKFTTVVTDIAQDVGDEIEFIVNPTTPFLEAGEALIINTIEAKSGAGIVAVQIEIDEF